MAMNLDETVFKAYDIRGTYPDQINAPLAEAVGRALADFLPEGVVVVGRDMRPESLELANALAQGLVTQGRQLIDIGLVTTDMLDFASGFFDAAGGAMITASHNPGQYNGIKFCGNQAASIGVETGLMKIRDLVKSGKFKTAERPGQIEEQSITEEWINHALSFVNAASWPPYQVAIDAGNGMAGQIIPTLQSKVPIQVTPLFFELDGSFPNHPANPAIEANLADLVATMGTHRQDLGVAFDGDGDRAFFVDELGRSLSASITGAILAQYLLQKSPRSAVLYDLRMSKIMPETVEANGGKAIRTPVGGAHIKPALRKHDGVLAAEFAGHYYFRDNYYSDSGLIAALLMMEIMATTGQKLSQIAQPFMKYFDSGELNHQVSNVKQKIDQIAHAYQGGQQDRLDGLTVDYGDWWFCVRPSNTEPLLRLNVEATTKELMELKRDELFQLIKT
jgi:phosphomannomutase